MSERLTQILSEYKQALDAAQSKRQQLLDANPDLADELLKHFDATGEPSIADTVDFGKPQYDTVTHVPRAEFDTVTPAPNKESRLARQTASNALSRFGDYDLIEEIARGGMGVVYKARQRNADRIVALKMILSGQLAGEDEVSRFHAEAKAAAKLDHPGIVPVYDVGEIDGKHYFSMGYVEGGSLSEKLKDGPLPPRVAAEYMKSIAEAVAFAHEQGVIHRDLKPGNILVGSDGHPRVTDFGLAKQLGGDSDLTATGQVMGTPSYMPPEQATGKLDEIGATSDVYSLGAVFYCLLTCRPPFQAASHVEILRQVIEQDPAGLRLLNRSIPKDVETICLKCLRKEPTQRYASSQDLADELQRWLNNEPIKARPVGRLEKSWLWCKRRPTLVATMVTAALLLVVVSWYLIIRGSDAEATRLVDGLLGAETSNVDDMITELSGYRKWAEDDLATAYEDPPPDLPNAKLHASLAMLHYGDASVLQNLKDELLTVSPGQFQYVRDLMSDHQDLLVADYWKIVKDDGETGKDAVARRFQAACALATYDPENEYWKDQEFVKFIANHLVRVRFSALGPWQQALSDVRPDLVEPLAEIFRDDTVGETERIYATETLADYLKDDPLALSRLLVDADSDSHQTLFPVLARHRQVALDELRGIASALPPEDLGSVERIAYGQRRANAAVTLLRLGERENVLPVFAMTDDPEASTATRNTCRQRKPPVFDPSPNLLLVALAVSAHHLNVGCNWFSADRPTVFVDQSFRSFVVSRDHFIDSFTCISTARFWEVQRLFYRWCPLSDIDQDGRLRESESAIFASVEPDLQRESRRVDRLRRLDSSRRLVACRTLLKIFCHNPLVS